MQKYDLIIIGAGPGGYVAAIRAAQLGAKVALIEKEEVGGVCLNHGCIPTKAILACTTLYDRIKSAGNFGITIREVAIDLEPVIKRKDSIIAKLIQGIKYLLEKNKIDLIYGQANVLAQNKVEVICLDKNKIVIEGNKLILATGSSPRPLPNLPFDGKKILSSDDLLRNRQPFSKLNIVGGGVIGIHFAQIYTSLGTKVAIYESLPEILPGVDEEIVTTLKRVLKRKGIEINTSTLFSLAKDDAPTLISIGRQPNLEGTGLLNLKMESKSVWVNDKLETSVAGVYAIGDLVSKKMLAHVASEQGIMAAENALGKSRSFVYDYVPYSIYTHPEVSGVGLTEKEAKEKHGEIKVGRFPFAALGIAQAMGEAEGFIKVVSDIDNHILGVHIIGPDANTLIGIATLALKNGLSTKQLAETAQSHPTYPEGVQEVALNIFKRSLHIIN